MIKIPLEFLILLDGTIKITIRLLDIIYINKDKYIK